MPFEWSDVGAGPALDQIEVSVFGPGFGECIVIHVGGGKWLVVDSCVDTTDRVDPKPVAEKYLRSIGVHLETQVALIVASHWHDDHVRGLARLVEVCKEARFCCSNALLQQEFFAFVETMSTGTAATDGAKVKEFRRVLSTVAADHARPATKYAVGSRTLATWPKATGALPVNVTLRSLSPSDKEFELFLQRIASEMPSHGQPKRAAARSSPNLASVVLHLDFGDTAVLLGADMEIHNDIRRGWTAVLDEAKVCDLGPASLFKVAHHGSQTGHHDQVWERMLETRPSCIVTPFNKLPVGKKLPTSADVDRISLRGKLFVTGSRDTVGHIRGRDNAVVRSLKENGIAVRDLRTAIGLVRMRRFVEPDASWVAEVFGAAHEVKV